MEYEWDEQKNARNIAERDFSFEYAKQVFFDAERFTIQDKRRDYGEPRFITFGQIEERLYVVGHTPRGKNITRIFSARKANRREQRAFAMRRKESTNENRQA